MAQGSLHRHSYILRFWRNHDPSGWKGWVQYVNSGNSMLIHSLDELLIFIEQQNTIVMQYSTSRPDPSFNTGESRLQ